MIVAQHDLFFTALAKLVDSCANVTELDDESGDDERQRLEYADKRQEENLPVQQSYSTYFSDYNKASLEDQEKAKENYLSAGSVSKFQNLVEQFTKRLKST